MTQSPLPHIHLKLWLEQDGDILLGVGRAQLLHRIEALGSLKKAAESMGMSYRAAWGRIKRTEAAMGLALVESTGTRRGGYSLSPAGKEVVEAFLLWHERVLQYALEEAHKVGISAMRNSAHRANGAACPCDAIAVVSEDGQKAHVSLLKAQA